MDHALKDQQSSTKPFSVRSIAATFAVCCLALFTTPVCAQRPQIRLEQIFPMGGQAGADTTLTIAGELTEAATELIFSAPGIEATQQIQPETEYTVAHRKPRSFDVRIGPDVPDGRYEVRALGPIGLSAPRTFCVSRLKERVFDANGNSRSQPFELAIGQTANARGRADQRDFYKFSAKQNESVLLQIWAERIDSKFDGEMAVYGPDGKRLARVRQSRTNDPILCLTPPTDGEYTVEVWEATFRGGNDYFYRLEVSERSQVEAIHPTVAKADTESEFTVFGYNLPGGTPISGSSGNLQSREIQFAPSFDDMPFNVGLANGNVSAARVNGGSVALPVPLSTSHVFMALAPGDVVREQANDELSSPQEVSVPVDIAGQFYPRRDVDWYQFAAKKGQTFRIDLYSQQLGTHADPILRVGMLQKDKDGKATLANVSVSDDVEGSPKNREQRRFFTGTVDSGYRFMAQRDGTYVISVTDQYNSSADDPSLIYQLSIAEESPNFRLVAYAEPERQNDEKIIKPNGVSICPGGRGLIRVRMLPQHGFQNEVTVVAQNLPAGVVAEPLTLNKQSPEGLLIVSAENEAASGASSVQIIGTSKQGERTIRRTARTGTICRSTNNVDQTPASVRLCGDLTVAVVDQGEDPVTFDSSTSFVASVGSKLKLPIRVARVDRFKDRELEITGASLPGGVKVSPTKTKSKQLELQTEIQKLPPGNYTIALSTKVKDRRPRNTVALREAESDLAKTTQQLTRREADLQMKTAVTERLRALVAQSAAAMERAEATAKLPREKLQTSLSELQALAQKLGEQLQASAADVANESLSEAVDVTQSKISALRESNKELRTQLSVAAKPFESLRALRTAQQSELDALSKSIETARKKRDEAKQKKDEFTKRVAELKKNELEKEAEFYVYSPPVQLEVVASPITLKSVSATPKLKRGETTHIPVAVQRRFGFSGPVHVSLSPSKGTGLTGTLTAIGVGQTSAKLAVTAAQDAPLGKKQATIQSKLKFNNIDIQGQLGTTLEVIE